MREVHALNCAVPWCFQSEQRRTPAEMDSRVLSCAPPRLCLDLTLHLICCLFIREYLRVDEMQGRPWSGSSSGPKYINLYWGRKKRKQGVPASQKGSNLPKWCVLGRPSNKAKSVSRGWERGWPKLDCHLKSLTSEK